MATRVKSKKILLTVPVQNCLTCKCSVKSKAYVSGPLHLVSDLFCLSFVQVTSGTGDTIEGQLIIN